MLDDGRLTDGQGRVVDFTNTIIIMTSNLGSEFILQDPENAEEKVRSVISHSFKPEFINRIDEIVIFNPLMKPQIEKIVEIQLRELGERLRRKGYSLSWDKSVEGYIADEGFDPIFGARPIRRCIQNEVENELSKALLSGQLLSGCRISLTLEEGRIGISCQQGLISE